MVLVVPCEVELLPRCATISSCVIHISARESCVQFTRGSRVSFHCGSAQHCKKKQSSGCKDTKALHMERLLQWCQCKPLTVGDGRMCHVRDNARLRKYSAPYRTCLLAFLWRVFFYSHPGRCR